VPETVESVRLMIMSTSSSSAPRVIKHFCI
jgi:hypothetical protein